MNADLQKDPLNETLKSSLTPIRVFEKGNDYLVLKFTGQTFTLFLISLICACFVSALLSGILAPLLMGLVFNLFLHTLDSCKEYVGFFIISFLFVEVLVIAYFIYLFLRKLNIFFFEVRFIGDRLKIINGNTEQEILLSDDVKFSIEKIYTRTSKYRLNVSYICNESVKEINLFHFSNYEGAELVLNRINKYLEQNKKSKG